MEKNIGIWKHAGKVRKKSCYLMTTLWSKISWLKSLEFQSLGLEFFLKMSWLKYLGLKGLWLKIKGLKSSFWLWSWKVWGWNVLQSKNIPLHAKSRNFGPFVTLPSNFLLSNNEHTISYREPSLNDNLTSMCDGKPVYVTLPSILPWYQGE